MPLAAFAFKAFRVMRLKIICIYTRDLDKKCEPLIVRLLTVLFRKLQLLKRIAITRVFTVIAAFFYCHDRAATWMAASSPVLSGLFSTSIRMPFVCYLVAFQ